MSMDKKIKEAFDQIHAEEDLKLKTKNFLEEKTNGYRKKRTSMYRAYIPAVICMAVFLIAGGYWMYFLPTVEIQVDINPSIELAVNRFDKVVSLEGKNEDGKELARELDVRFLDYEEAVNRILETDQITDLLEQDEIASVVVVGEKEKQCKSILSSLESVTENQSNVDCYFASTEEAAEAEKAGLNYGKYKAYLELKELDPDVTTEEVKNMSMKEIRNRIQELTSQEGESDQSETSHNNGQGKKYQNGQKKGKGKNG